MIKQPKEINQIVGKLTAENYDVYYAGQCVTAGELGEEPQDWDLYTNCPQQRLRELYAQRDALYRECAHFVVNTRGLSLQMLVNRVQMQLELCGK